MEEEKKAALKKKLECHDWYYNYSDDHSCWRRGEQAWSAIVAACKDLPVHVAREVWDAAKMPDDCKGMFPVR